MGRYGTDDIDAPPNWVKEVGREDRKHLVLVHYIGLKRKSMFAVLNSDIKPLSLPSFI